MPARLVELHSRPTDSRRRRREDASWRPGDLPEGLGAILLAADAGPGMRCSRPGWAPARFRWLSSEPGAAVVGYEIREDFARTSEGQRDCVGRQRGVRRQVPRGDPRRLRRDLGDASRQDGPRPSRALARLPHAESALRSGGILCSYLPTINQTAQLRDALEHSRFGLEQTFEVLHRTWHIEARSVRPDHRMVAHTGFLTTARLLSGGD